jgi:hypothetical protein
VASRMFLHSAAGVLVLLMAFPLHGMYETRGFVRIRASCGRQDRQRINTLHAIRITVRPLLEIIRDCEMGLVSHI